MDTKDMQEEIAAPKPADPAESTGSLEVNLIGDRFSARIDGKGRPALNETCVELYPDFPPTAPSVRLWHRVSREGGFRVTVRSGEMRIRSVVLSLESESPGWNPAWVRWSYAARRPPGEFEAGAVASQDRLDEGDQSLTLLILPGEQRDATLEFKASLDGQTRPGVYDFHIIARDYHDGETVRAFGTLHLRHPRSRLLEQLPAIYQQQPDGMGDIPLASGSKPYDELVFFERYLLGFEDAIEPTKQLLANLADFFDPDFAPPDFLPWLSSMWVALELDANWPQLKRRRLIKEIVHLYRWRGTRRGLHRYLQIYTGLDKEILIEDKPMKGMRLGPQALMGLPQTKLGDIAPHTFVVTIPAQAVPDRRVVDDIIRSQKPAHTSYALRLVDRPVGEAARA